jgi:hypothetical protein
VKLLPRQVRAIRCAYATSNFTIPQLAHRYGISEVWMWKLVHGESRHKSAGGPVIPPQTHLLRREAESQGLKGDSLFVIGSRGSASDQNASLPSDCSDNEYYAENRGRPPPVVSHRCKSWRMEQR